MNDSEHLGSTGPEPVDEKPRAGHGDGLPVMVLYDGQCPLCSREIAHYRRRRGADGIEWLDVTCSDTDPAPLGVTREAALARFHVRDTRGIWRTGAAGFVLLWSGLPAYRWLARLVTALRLLPAMEWGYTRFLRWRSRDRCDAGGCRKAL